MILCFAAFLVPVRAQDFRRAFDDFTEAARQIHRNFGDSLNAEFARTISANWERFGISAPDTLSRRPRPQEPPVASESDRVFDGVIKVFETVDTLSVDFPSGPSVPVSAPSGRFRPVRFVFYDMEQVVNIPVKYGSFHPSGISEKDIGEFWYKLGKEDFSPVVAVGLDNRNRFGYNDWAVLEWVQALSCAIYPADVNSERHIFEVFILNQMGLMAKLARTDDRLESLFCPLQQVYARKYTVIDTYRYYFTDTKAQANEIFTYKADFGGKVRPFDLRIKSPLTLGNQNTLSVRDFDSKVFGHRFEVPLNGALNSFYDRYPQTTVDVYARSVPDSRFSEALVGQLKPLLSGKTGTDLLNELLRFVQYDFTYRTDDEQFGREKQFFCEENFLYDANDCEDRAVLFSFLVRRLSDLKTVLLEYDDHVATAVRLDSDVKGCYFDLSDGKYIICDPTYIGATAGMCIPGYVRKRARIYIL